MKINGKEVNALNIVTVEMVRDNCTYTFTCHPVEDFDVFDKLCPFPEAPKAQRPGTEEWFSDLKDPGYIAKRTVWVNRRIHYTFLKSIHLEGLEWETVDELDPDTWTNIDNELKAAGFVEMERERIYKAVNTAQGLDERKLEAARNDFLPGQETVNA